MPQWWLIVFLSSADGGSTHFTGQQGVIMPKTYPDSATCQAAAAATRINPGVQFDWVCASSSVPQSPYQGGTR